MEPGSVFALAALVKAAQPISEPFAKKGAALLGKLLGPGATALGDRIGEFLSPPAPPHPTVLDTIAMWRHGNMTLLLCRTAELLDEMGVAPRPLPVGVLLPLLETASLIDDIDLRQVWAQLLASGVESDEHQHPMWVRLLAQLSPDDARTFLAACAHADQFGLDAIKAEADWPYPVPAGRRAMVRLVALGLLAPVADATGWHTRDDAHAAVVGRAVDGGLQAAPTTLGAEFRRAVSPRGRAPDRSS